MADLPRAESLSFPQAISKTQSLMEQISSNKISEAEIQQQVASLLTSKNGGRGFFVAYLTSQMSLADNPSSGIIRGLKTSPDLASELLIKNLAMSSAMIVLHRRHADPDKIKGSETVYRRTNNLIQKLKLKSIEEQLRELESTLKNGIGEYQNFLQRWNYDIEQKKAIQNAIQNL